MQIGDDVYHPCDYDILHFKVAGIRYHEEDPTLYELKAVHNVGAQGRIVVLVAHAGDRLQYVDLLEPSDDINERGLEGFIEGEYFESQDQARLAFYTVQELLSWTSLEQQRRVYEKQLEAHNRLVKVLEVAREKVSKA